MNIARPCGTIVLQCTDGEEMGSGIFSVGPCFPIKGMLIQLQLKQFSLNWHIKVQVGILF